MTKRMHMLLGILLLMVFSFSALAATETPGKLVFFIQQDIRPEVDPLFFNAGMQYLFKNLDPKTQVQVYYSQINQYELVMEGQAGTLTWPPAKVQMGTENPSTTPYKNLYSYLKKNKVADQTVIFISNGTSKDMFQFVDTEGFMQGDETFTPNSYQPAQTLKNYCKKNNVHLIGIYVRNTTVRSEDFRDISFTTFRYVVEESGGKAYYGFSTFKGLFQNLISEGALF